MEIGIMVLIGTKIGIMLNGFVQNTIFLGILLILFLEMMFLIS